MKDMKKLADQVFPDFQKAARDLSRLHGWSFDSLRGAARILVPLVKHVEEVGKLEELTGAEKQELAVELALRVLKLPWWMPRQLAKGLLAEGVNLAVAALKDRF